MLRYLFRTSKSHNLKVVGSNPTPATNFSLTKSVSYAIGSQAFPCAMTDFCAVPQNPFVLRELHGFRDPLRSAPKPSVAHGWHMELPFLPPQMRCIRGIGPQFPMTPFAPFNPSRLTWARRRRGNDQIELGALIGTTVRSIKAYEAGAFAPGAERLRSIARALHFPERFFLGDEIEDLTPKASFQRAFAMRRWAAQRSPSPSIQPSSGSMLSQSLSFLTSPTTGTPGRPRMWIGVGPWRRSAS